MTTGRTEAFRGTVTGKSGNPQNIHNALAKRRISAALTPKIKIIHELGMNNSCVKNKGYKKYKI